jgi:S1-C subfamily serine protease
MLFQHKLFSKRALVLLMLCTVHIPVLLFAESDLNEDIVKTYEKSVVMIMTVRQEFDYVTPWKKLSMSRGVGTGFVIDGNRILTNAHNVANARYIEVTKQYVAQRYPAQVQFIGHDCDLALLTVADSSFFTDTTPLSLGPVPRVNSTVHTCGFPLGGRQISITEGVVSRIETGTYSHTQSDSHLIVQTDAAINPGNSGGRYSRMEKWLASLFRVSNPPTISAL